MENVQGKVSGIFKSVLFSVIFLLLSILIFAAVIKIFGLADATISFVNQILKASAILLGCLFGLRGEKIFIKSVMSGLFTIILSYVIFTLLSKGTLFSVQLVYEILFGMIAGALSGIIVGFMKKN